MRPGSKCWVVGTLQQLGPSPPCQSLAFQWHKNLSLPLHHVLALSSSALMMFCLSFTTGFPGGHGGSGKPMKWNHYLGLSKGINISFKTITENKWIIPMASFIKIGSVDLAWFSRSKQDFQPAHGIGIFSYLWDLSLWIRNKVWVEYHDEKQRVLFTSHRRR